MTVIYPDKRLKLIFRLSLIIFSFLPAVGVSFFLKDAVFITAACLWFVTFLFLYVFYIPVYFKNLVYIINGETVTLKCGVIYSSIYNIPLHKVQFTSIVMPPLYRPFGLVALKIVAPGANIVMHGITLKEARRLNKLITSAAEVQ